MPHARLAGFALIATFAAGGTAAAQPAQGPVATTSQPAPAEAALVNEREPLPSVYTGGLRPEADTGEVLRMLADDGVRTYIDLRSPEEGLDAARAAAAAAGLAYVSIPVAGEGDLDLATVRALDAVLSDPSRGPAAVACASGNRSGALLALRAFWLAGAPAEDALALGRAAGLTRFEPQVRTLLGLPPAPAADAAPESSKETGASRDR